jgi:dTDP-4-amino-4,6-dideoxygalactose transaminase
MRISFLPFGSPLIGKEEIEEVIKTLKSGWISTGPKVREFEEKFKAYIGGRYALAVNSCTAGLHLALKVIGIKEEDEVLVPTLTFAATANVITHLGGKVVFVDSEPIIGNISIEDLKKKITKKTKAIIPVHLYGRPCNMDEILELGKKYNLKIIGDCAHSIETEYKNKKIGTFGDINCFSFYATKNLVTGEGGMIITNNLNYVKQIEILRLHGMSRDAWKRYIHKGFTHYEILSPGYKYNMTDIQASLGIHQLKKIEKYWRKRKKIWEKYNFSLQHLPIIPPPPVKEGERHAYHLYTILLQLEKLKISRDDFITKMFNLNIGVGVHFIPLHLHPYYRNKFGYKKGDFPNAEWIGERTVSLPLYPKLKNKEVEDVVFSVTKITKEFYLKKFH